MKKLVVILSILIFVCITIMAFQFLKIQRLEQRFTYTIDFVSIKAPLLLTRMINDDEIPEDDRNVIINDLRQRTRLIPVRGILGGTMRYTAAKWIHKIDHSRGYIIAWAQDGHIGIDMLLPYTRGDDDSIKWVLIAYRYIYGAETNWVPNKR